MIERVELFVQQRRFTAALFFLSVLILVIVGALLRVGPISRNGLHEDEALYGFWALEIASGADPLLDRQPVDKPPLYIYALAGMFSLLEPSEAVARVPNVLVSLITILLVARLAGRVYGRPAGLLAALFHTINPFDLSFATTAFTDPMMVMFAILSLVLAVEGWMLWAGFSLGLAFATKQQAILFLPLIVLAGLLFRDRSPSSRIHCGNDRLTAHPLVGRMRAVIRSPWLQWVAGMAAMIGLVMWWDGSRLQRPGYLEQSFVSYGGLGLTPLAELWEKAGEWYQVLGTLSGSPQLFLLTCCAIIALLLVDLSRSRKARSSGRISFSSAEGMDFLLVAFIAGFLLLHWLCRFQPWDRYLLGLAPLFSVLIGRLLSLIPGALPTSRSLPANSVIRVAPFVLAGALWVGLLLGPACAAADGRYPAGGDRGVYDGIAGLTGYIKANVPVNAVLYHRWLGHHYRFYLYGSPQALRWYRTPEELADFASEWWDVPSWVAFPTWRDHRDAEAALAVVGLGLAEHYQARRQDGSLSFRLFEILPLSE